jgi:hypothetical protein
MRLILRYLRRGVLVLAAGALAAPAFAQHWEVGGLGGGSFYTKKSVTSPAGTGDVGFKNGYVVGGLVGNDMYNYMGGELRYEYVRGALMVKSGGTEATMSGEAHAIHYDFLVYATRRGSHIRPFLAAGGGVKVFRGRGPDVVFQPLNRLALLTRTNEVKGLGSFGAGVKVRIGEHLGVRVEFRDFITPFPKKVIAPSIGASISSGIIHDFVPMVGVTYTR